MYRVTRKSQQQQTRQRASQRTREANRMAAPAPDYPAVLPDLRMRITVEARFRRRVACLRAAQDQPRRCLRRDLRRAALDHRRTVSSSRRHPQGVPARVVSPSDLGMSLVLRHMWPEGHRSSQCKWGSDESKRARGIDCNVDCTDQILVTESSRKREGSIRRASRNDPSSLCNV